MLSDGELLSDLLLCSRPAPFVPNTALISTKSAESFLELCTELLSHSSVVTLAREWHLSMPSPSSVNPSPKIMLRSSLPSTREIKAVYDDGLSGEDKEIFKQGPEHCRNV